MSDYVEGIERNGFAIIKNVVDIETVEAFVQELKTICSDKVARRRAGKAFGIRNLLNVLPSARILANSELVRALIEPVLGGEARVVRGIYFDKHRDANWKVAWHQDVTIAVRKKVDVDGYGPWSMKAGILHVQPPVSILQNGLTLRVHLDPTDDSNGPLHVLPGSHRHGRLSAAEIQSWRQRQCIATCTVAKGGVMVMRPLLLHASSAASIPTHRRVLHFEYSSSTLPSGLDWFDS